MKKAIIGTFILFAVFFIASEKSFAQFNPSSTGPCLLGVNCTPTGNTTTTTSTVNQPGTKTERFILGPALSAQVLKSIQNGSRHLLTLKRYNAPNNPGCVIEDRAWVAQIEGNNGTQITVKVGNSRSVLVCNPSQTIESVNNSEGWIQYYRNQIAIWQKEQERLAQYFGNPYYAASARQEYQKATGYINTYAQCMTNLQTAVAKVAP